MCNINLKNDKTMKQIIFILISLLCLCSCSNEDVYNEVLPEQKEIVVKYNCTAESVCLGCMSTYKTLQGNFVYNTELQVVKIYTMYGVLELNKYQVIDLYEVILRLKKNECGNQSLVKIINNEQCSHWLYNGLQIKLDFIELLYDTIKNKQQ